MWDLSCADWPDRLRAGRSLVPDLPLFESEARDGLAYFDAIRLPDQPDEPRLGDAAGQWFRDIVRAGFGSWDPVRRERWIRDILLLAPKGQSKTTYFAGLLIAVLLMNERRNAEAMFVGPTQSISDRAFDQAAGMIELDPALKRRFKLIGHQKIIEDRQNGTQAAVKTFDLNIVTGGILIFALVDELHLLGRNKHTMKVLRQIRGGLDKTPEGLLVVATTQSDDEPTGAFRDELIHARRVRDGAFRGQQIRPLLPVLYEFPPEIATDERRWQDAKNWPLVLPNIGRSVHLRDMIPDWETERGKGDHARRIWASQHLNIEIGVGTKANRWPGAEDWERRCDPKLTLAGLLDRCEVVVVGGDGGGKDDLFGLNVLGRERDEIEIEVTILGNREMRKVKRWLSWSHAWCHEGVLDRRQAIASRLQTFADLGELTIVDDELADLPEIVAHIEAIQDRGLLAEVAVDTAAIGELVDELAKIDVTEENGRLVGIGQGGFLMPGIKAVERRLTNGTLLHAPSTLMDWCVGNVKIEPTATGIRATKQSAGDAKIDPAVALWNAGLRMARNPVAAAPFDALAMIV